jgi:hypothetical protein
MKRIILIGLGLLLICCENRLQKPSEKPSQSIFMFRDKDGLYEYDVATAKEKLIHKLQDWQVFLDEPYRLSGDTLTFGMVGQQASSTEYEGLNYYNYYVSVDLKTGKNRVSREIKYSTDLADRQLNIKVCDIDLETRQKIVHDTTMPYLGYVSSYRGMVFNDNRRFYSEHTVGNKKVYSENGSLYCTTSDETGNQTDLLIENQTFDPKFGNGYLQPQLDPTGNYVICTFVPGFLKQGASLYKVILAGKKTEVVKEGLFNGPQFCADGKFVLFSRDLQQNKRQAWESDIYVLDLKTLHETKIGKAGLAQWKTAKK